MKAVILAAGLSRRFGGKKLIENINEKPMVVHVADLVSTMEFDQKVFVYSDEEVRKAVKESCDKVSNFTFIYNDDAKAGLSSSIKLALKTDNEILEGIIFFVGDQPFLDEATVNKLLEAFYQKKGSIIVPTYKENRGNPVIFSNKWIKELKNLEGDVGGRVIIRKHPEEVFEVKIDNSLVGKDIDTKEELYSVHSERNLR